MNDSPGWATPGSSPSDGERPGAPADQPAQPAADPRWSAQQPPPGQWQSPAPQTPPPPQPGPGWGQQPPYGHPGGPGQWGAPPAAKPGVIPLRPLGLGEILDGAVATMRSHWRSVLPITLVVATVIQVISLITQKYAMADLALSSGSEADVNASLDNIGTTLTLLAATLFIAAIGGLVATAMLTMIYSRAVLGTPSTVATAWREARSQLLRLLGLTLLLTLGAALLAGVLMLPGILAQSPGLILAALLLGFPVIGAWLWIKFSLASPALMLEKTTVFKSLARSSKLVKGTWWRIFGITVLTALITGMVSAIIVWPLTLVGMVAFGGGLTGMADGTASTAWGALILSGIGTIIAQTITMPIQSGVTVLLYVDQRIRREGLDLELARAAGVENYGTTGG
ncbi:hypothetical protein ACFTWH_27600 [Streptomyces sp. NPDC057011]|uniref:hypothetical protein n=1 Tax=unclassified Streptomyces TaxID=2593676 RepID=UPI00363A9993